MVFAQVHVSGGKHYKQWLDFHLVDIKLGTGLSSGVYVTPFHSQVLPCNYCDVSLENLVLDHLIIPYLILFFLFITCQLDVVLILQREFLSWSFVEVDYYCHCLWHCHQHCHLDCHCHRHGHHRDHFHYVCHKHYHHCHYHYNH